MVFPEGSKNPAYYKVPISWDLGYCSMQRSCWIFALAVVDNTVSLTESCRPDKSSPPHYGVYHIRGFQYPQ